jgi:opacity protein-like surface antigen
MKLLTIASFFAVVLTPSANSQHLLPFGLKLGPVSAQQNWDYTPESGISNASISSIWGIDVGLTTELLDAQFFILQIELHYVQKGRTITITETVPANNPQGYIDIGQSDIKQRFNYLSIPLLAKLSIPFGAARPFICVGPSFEYLISYPSSPVYDQFRKTEIGATVSAGADFSTSFGFTISPEIRYARGLTQSFKNGNVTVTTQALAFLLGISL